MKSFKVKMFVCFLIVFSNSVKSQNLETLATYYDYAGTQVKEVYTVKKGSGIKQGMYRLYDENRMLIFEVPFINNLKNGVARQYFNQADVLFHEKPMLAYGKLMNLMTYKNDELNGSYKIYAYEKGKQILRYDNTWFNGEIIKETEFYNNGKKKSSLQKNGVCNYWYETGEKMSEFTNIENTSVGIQTEWFKNGKINIQGTWNNESKQEGIWKNWDENGNLTETLYENGIDIEEEKVLKENQLKVENENNEKIKKQQEADNLIIENELEKKRLTREKENKEDLIGNKNQRINDKSSEVDKKYIVLDDIQTVIFGKDLYKTKKKNLYNAFDILRNDLLEKINSNKDLDNKLLMQETLEKLLDKVINYINVDTKDLEKELKNVTDVNIIKDIFKI